MNSAVVAAFAAVLAVANAGYLGAPALGYATHGSSLAGYGISHSTGIVRGAPLVGAYGAHHSLVRVARGILAAPVAHAPLATYAAGPIAHPAAIGYAGLAAPIAHAAPLAYSAHAAPLAYSSPALLARSYHVNPLTLGGAAHIRVARGILAAPVAHAPLTTYAAGPIAHSAALGYAGPIAHAAPLAYSAPLAHAAPLAYSAHAAPLAYSAHAAPLAYAGVPAIHGGVYGARAYL